MEYEKFTVRELRDSARHFVPESRGVRGLAHTGNKEQLINLRPLRWLTQKWQNNVYVQNIL
jgi:hypothetical protein